MQWKGIYDIPRRRLPRVSGFCCEAVPCSSGRPYSVDVEVSKDDEKKKRSSGQIGNKVKDCHET